MLAVLRARDIPAVGLCHSVQGTSAKLAGIAGVPMEEVRFRCAGINHMAFYQKFVKKINGQPEEDLYPRLKALAEEIVTNKIISSNTKNTKETSIWTNKVFPEKVRYEILRRFGYFVTESSQHFAEYVPWFIKQNRQDLIDQYEIPIDIYIDRCERNNKYWEKMNVLMNEPLKRSNEYASYIMDAISNNNAVTINANVMNNNLIDNLPDDCCVEVPCVINSDGCKPQKIGRLPEHLAALMRTNINVQLLTAEAAITKKREHIYHAAMLDPLTAANLSIDEIYSMTDELIEAHGDYLKFN